jgi:hypothetical protein
VCNFCACWEAKIKSNNNNNGDIIEVPDHPCTKNHDGTSSAMEPQACLEMVVSLYDNSHCIVNRICCDDDASTRSLLRWSNEDYMRNNNTTKPPTIAKPDGTMRPRPDKGKLPGHIPEPLFVADPNHRKKVFTGDLWKRWLER